MIKPSIQHAMIFVILSMPGLTFMGCGPNPGTTTQLGDLEPGADNGEEVTPVAPVPQDKNLAPDQI